MKSFAVEIRIQSPADKVWRILADLPNWAEWNSTIERTEGNIHPGAKVTVYVKSSPGRAFPLSVAELDAPYRMVWTGGTPFGLFRGTRLYELRAPSSAETVFFMREDYSGPLAAVITRSIPNLQPSFDEFARCLKQKAER